MMKLDKKNWTDNDINEFYNYQKTLKGSDKEIVFEQKIINTKLECFGKTSYKAKELVKQIKKGNYIDFLDKIVIKSFLDSLIVAHLLNQIKDFKIYQKYLNKYIKNIDNWCSVDTLKFNYFNNNDLFLLSKKYLKSNKEFVRRLAISIYFKLIKDNKYIDETFNMLDGLKNENKYYVNMMASWLLAELFINNKSSVLQYFKNNSTNDFIINKAISKIRDSYRVDRADKEMILKYKR